MTVKTFLVAIIVCCVSFSLTAQNKMDVRLLKQMQIQQAKGKSDALHHVSPQSFLTVIAVLHDEKEILDEELAALEVQTLSHVGRVLSLRVPFAKLDQLASHTAIQSLNAPRRHHTTCLNTRMETGVAVLHDAGQAIDAGLDQTYTGRGVLLGIVDTGIQYQHINFRNPQTGQTRLKGAVLYRPEVGAVDSIREYYIEPNQLDTLTTDNLNDSHGTHTSGIAAGSYPDLNMQGMAPEADLMFCGTTALEDDRIIDALVTTFARADELGVPCVINLSIGNPVDWKDGQSAICLACETLTDGGNHPGRAIVFSAGNDGAKRFTAHHLFADTSAVYTLLQPTKIDGSAAYVNPDIEAYCSDSLPLALDFLLYDTLKHEFHAMPFEQHLVDTLEAGHGGRRHLSLDTDTCRMLDLPHQLLALRLKGVPGSSVSLYYINNNSVDYAMLSPYELAMPPERVDGCDNGPTWIQGTPAQSISDLCCTDAVLSVGAYSAVDSLVNVFGRTVYPWAPSGEVCSFSSYGTLSDGTPKPDVIAPGASVVSSFSSYWEDKIIYYYTSQRYLTSPMMYVVTPQGEDEAYYWIHSVGTSQSSPVVAGIIAQWMEACPSLTVRQIREILQSTSRFDDHCLHAPGGPIQAGEGKIDAVKGLQEVLARLSVPAITNNPSAKRASRSYNLFGQPMEDSFSGRSIIISEGKISFPLK